MAEIPPLSSAIFAARKGIGGSFQAVTKSDTVPLPPNVIGLWVGGIGNVAVKGVGDAAAVTFTAVAAGTFIPGRFAYVMSTNTTATLIVALIEI